MTKNPYKVIEKIGNVTLIVIVILFCAAALAAVIWPSIEYWGWWALLLIPGIPVGLVVVMLIGWAASSITYAISDKWRRAKWGWEDNHERSTR